MSYSAVLEAVRHQRQIAEPILLEALERGMLAKPRARTDAAWLFDLHDHSEGSAVTATRLWLEREVAPWHFGAGADDPTFVGLITGYGKSRESWGQSDVKAAVTQLLVEEMGVPVDSTSVEAKGNNGDGERTRSLRIHRVAV